MFFLIFILTFAVILSIITDQKENEVYKDVGKLAFFLIAVRTSIGDFSDDTFTTVEVNKYFVWVIWLVIIIVGNVIFMNFIISVVSQSYADCMSKMVSQ